MPNAHDGEIGFETGDKSDKTAGFLYRTTLKDWLPPYRYLMNCKMAASELSWGLRQPAPMERSEP